MHMFSDMNRNIYSNPFYLINISHPLKRNSALPISQLPIAYWLLPVVLRFLQFVVFASCLFPDSCLYSCNGQIHRVMGLLRPWPRAWGQGFAAEGPRGGLGVGARAEAMGIERIHTMSDLASIVPCQVSRKSLSSGFRAHPI